MNTNQSTPNGTFTFQCVVQFEIDPATAANLLVESCPSKTVHEWLLSQRPSPEDAHYSGNATNLRAALGQYLAENEVSKARLALPEGDIKTLPF